ncbi:ABC transporter ATP-binding protein [Halobacillus kuroshimensis]|uniref:ABC transporter ATP-binding protein n=1 Tax=Halobacillus kuroshimensis TaxID=302481 RepID=UPI0003FA406A|nr:ABC transporter ATP-binding protein [Halobacillus kuroshimensis]
MYAVETYQLSKVYGDKKVVNEINLQVKKGSIFGFLGKNGAGKSTFINMITGLTNPTSGSYTLLPDQGSSADKLRSRIGVLPDYSTFYDDLTALGHLKYFSRILGLKVSKSHMEDLLKKVGLEDAINQKAKKFSFGMKKKLGLAQALINEPDLLFLDEPTSGVDANAILNIHEIIQDIAAQGTTIFLTSHNLDEVEKLCDEIAIMDQGTIKTQGTMAQLRHDYQSNITVHIKHSEIQADVETSLNQELKAYGSDVEVSSKHTDLVVSSEQTIAAINRLYLKKDIDIFRIEVNEPTLEEIFLSTGENKQSA